MNRASATTELLEGVLPNLRPYIEVLLKGACEDASNNVAPVPSKGPKEGEPTRDEETARDLFNVLTRIVTLVKDWGHHVSSRVMRVIR